MKDKPIIVALDFADLNKLEALVEQLDPSKCRLKIGKQAFTLFGPELVKSLVKKNFDVFLDLKFHDIPNTVAQACRAAADLGVWMLNVHASGGEPMMQAARKALDSDDEPLLIAVTVLTSMTDMDLQAMRINYNCQQQAQYLAQLAQQAGMDGVVCSAHEAAALKQLCGADFTLVTPGIRLQDDASDDQQRIMTPIEALEQGADYLVMGRSITQANNPIDKLSEINLQIMPLKN